MNTNALVVSVALFALGLLVVGNSYAHTAHETGATARQVAVNRT